MSGVPTSVGRYQVLTRIGQGGMGSLYLALDPKLDRQIVIKLLMHDNDELRERFAREARSAARLRHTHIVTIFDVGEDQGQPFIAMEYVQGQTLAEIIRNKEPLTIVRKLRLIEELCGGLGFAHKAGIVHRDIKPANAMVDANGALKILDFGIARIAEAAGMTQAGMLIGTLNYMSPEQVAGEAVDARSDIFAVGAVAYELLSYRQAFPGGLQDGILNRILHGRPEPLESLCPDLDREIIRIVGRALEKGIEKRYQDLDSMGRDVHRVRMRLEADEESVDTSVVANAASQPTVVTPMPPPRRSGDREEIARRRLSQIQSQIEKGERAFSDGEYEAAIAACEEALLLDPDERRAIDLLERGRVELDKRQADEWLGEADREIERGALAAARAMVEQALAVHPSSTRGADLRKRLDEAQRERDRARQRAEQVRQALGRAYGSYDKGAFKDALAAADEALTLAPDLAEAATLKARCVEAVEAHERDQIERGARSVIRDARRTFASGGTDAAIAMLENFEPKHPLVSEVIDELRAEVERIGERRRQDTAERIRQERIATELLKTRTEIEHQQFTIALDRLHALEQSEGASSEIARLAEEAKAGKASQEIAQEVGRELDHARALAARDDLTAALARVDAALALDSGHEPARALRADIAARLAEAERREEESRRLREQQQQAIVAAIATSQRTASHEAAITALRRALDLDPDHAEAQAELQRRQRAFEEEQAEARRRQEREEQVAKAIEEAKGTASHEAAVGVLRRALEIDPDHAIAQAELKRRQKALEQERAEARRRREREEKIAKAIEEARKTASHEAAIGVLRRALEIDANHATAQGELKRRQEALEAEQQAEARRRREREEKVTRAIEEARKTASHEAAVKVLGRALEIDPDHATAQAELKRRQKAFEQEQAEARRAQEERARRAAEAARLERERLDRIQRFLRESREAVAAGKSGTARELAQRVLGLDPENRDATNLLRDLAAAEKARAASNAGAVPADDTVQDDSASTIGFATEMRSRIAEAQRVEAAEQRALTSPAGLLPSWVKVYAIPGGAVAALIILVIAYALSGRPDTQPQSSTETPAAPTATPSAAAGASATPEPQAPTSVPAEPAATTSVDRGNLAEQDSTRLLRLARQQFQRGDREQALTTVTNGLALWPQDVELSKLLNETLRNARARATQSRDAATKAGAAAVGTASYQEGERLARGATAQESARQTDQAIRSLWTAANSYAKAIEDGKAVVEREQAVAAERDRTAAADRERQAAAERDRAATADRERAAAAAERDRVAAADRERAATAAAAARDRSAAEERDRTAAAERTAEETAVRNVLTAYTTAYSNLSAAAVKRVFPSVNEAALSRAFAQIKSQRVQIEGEQITVSGTTATVACTWSTSTEGQVGGTQRATQKITLRLQKSPNGWILVDRR